jgi:hypothetical protein
MSSSTTKPLRFLRFGAVVLSVLFSLFVGFMAQASSPDYRRLFLSILPLAAVNVVLITFVAITKERGKDLARGRSRVSWPCLAFGNGVPSVVRNSSVMKTEEPNHDASGNGASALLFHVGRYRRAVSEPHRSLAGTTSAKV